MSEPREILIKVTICPIFIILYFLIQYLCLLLFSYYNICHYLLKIYILNNVKCI